MHFFKKSDKNKTTSAAPTPAQTPRVSLDESRPSNVGSMTTKQQRQAKENEQLYSLIAKAVAGPQNGPYIL